MHVCYIFKYHVTNSCAVSYSQGSDCEKLIMKHVFDYYISHNDGPGALQFLMSRTPPLADHTPCPAYIDSLVSAMPHTTEHVRNILLDALAR